MRLEIFLSHNFVQNVALAEINKFEESKYKFFLKSWLKTFVMRRDTYTRESLESENQGMLYRENVNH